MTGVVVLADLPMFKLTLPETMTQVGVIGVVDTLVVPVILVGPLVNPLPGAPVQVSLIALALGDTSTLNVQVVAAAAPPALICKPLTAMVLAPAAAVI